MLWGGLPENDALYLNITPENNDGTAVYKLNVQDVPVGGFWSITVYNAKGYLDPNPYNASSLNNITAEKNADGSVAASSAAATARFRIVCRLWRAGITWCDSIARAPKS